MKKYLAIALTLLCCASAAAAECLLHSGGKESTASFAEGATECLQCHSEYSGVMQSHMVTRKNEKTFVQNMFGKIDPGFYGKNCGGCHVNSCLDCHETGRPTTDTCLKCHNGGNIGADYAGLGIREDHVRYSRGKTIDTKGVNDGEHYMKMLPDIHFQKGITCGECHSMASLAGKEAAKDCLSCHKYSQKVIDHSIKGHSNVTCVACHAAWSPNEYGTFYIRLVNSESKEYYRWVKQLSEEYVKSSFMRLNSSPALAKNKDSLYTPVRPRVVYFTDVLNDQLNGRENRMLSDRWELFTPHTVRRETPTCDKCHNDRRKYLLETDEERYLLPEKDGLNIKSFLSSRYFTLQGGAFVTEEEFMKLSAKTPEYIKNYFKQLEALEKTITGANVKK